MNSHNAAANAKASPAVPHSWDLSNWPAQVWPNDPKRAAWIIRSNKTELIAEGALARVGKTRIVIGHPYSRWLERRTTRFAEYQGNNPAIRKSIQPRNSRALLAKVSGRATGAA